eukprot:TRINITY_DN10649_c0_g3_i1.p1 TRINITY_DN10649_c0_g3~~TRINITY_DN10649_c0_g3_i1.p1  ORF type:complete len:548 (+),score=119.65 TRINITY_DN10649_c0_g3_i1:75-1718(+)
MAGPLSEAFQNAVWRHLLSLPGNGTAISYLRQAAQAQPEVLQAWDELQKNLKSEGWKKATGVKMVLAARPDLFELTVNERGEPYVVLTEGAATIYPEDTDPDRILGLSPGCNQEVQDMEGLPDNMEEQPILEEQTTVEGQPIEEDSLEEQQLEEMHREIMEGLTRPIEEEEVETTHQEPADIDAAGTSLEEVLQANGQETHEDTDEAATPKARVVMAPGSKPPGPWSGANVMNQVPKAGGPWLPGRLEHKRPPEQQQGPAAKVQKGASKVKNKSGTRGPPTWTPELAAEQEQQRIDASKDEQNKRSRMVWCLYEALLNMLDVGESASVSQLGADHKVAAIKQDPLFKNKKLLDIVRMYPAVFTVEPDAKTGFKIGVANDAISALPEADEEYAKEMAKRDELAKLLPVRILESEVVTPLDKMQALRIEIMHALHRRDGRCSIQELGQDAKLQYRKNSSVHGRSLKEFMAFFPSNFTLVTSEQEGLMVEQGSYDVNDTSMMNRVLMYCQRSWGNSSWSSGWRGVQPRSAPLGKPSNSPPRVVPSRFPES